MTIRRTVPESASRAVTAGAVAIFLAAALVPERVHAAEDDKTMTTIKRDSEAAKAQKMEEPSYRTREERLKAKPLDWKATIGKPKQRKLTAAEDRALRKGKPKSAGGGAPNPKADEEARKLYPEDWNTPAPTSQSKPRRTEDER